MESERGKRQKLQIVEKSHKVHLRGGMHFYNNIDYLLKPFSFERFEKAFQKAASKYKSTNSEDGAQEHILDKLGYGLVRRLKDDRGEGIDTVYFVKKEENDR